MRTGMMFLVIKSGKFLAITGHENLQKTEALLVFSCHLVLITLTKGYN